MTENGARTRVGIISFAHVHAPQYAAVLQQLGDIAEFAGISDDDAGRGREAAERFGVEFMEMDELLGAVDAVVVCSENSRHAAHAVPALERGVHVLCEKPIATTVEDARAMISASERSGARLGIAFPVRFHPAVRRAKAAVEAGAIGRVIAINGTNHGGNPGGWFVDPELSGGGAVMDHTVHVADVIRWMLGAEVESVYAEVGAFFGAEGIDDAGILTLELEDGSFATIDPSWSRGEGFPTWGDVTLQITGTEGVISLDAFAKSTTVYNQRAPGSEWRYTGDDMNLLMIQDFVLGVQAGVPAGASGVDGLRALEIVLAAYESGRDHEPKAIERA